MLAGATDPGQPTVWPGLDVIHGGEEMKLRILIADDHEVVRRGLCALLQAREGWEICAEAKDGREAVEKAAQLKPDVVILDVGMPGMSGPELQRELKLRGQHIPIVFITANRDEAVRPRVLAQGAVACLFKPFSDTALLEALNTALQVN